ncbi:camp-regulated phosphoprotein family protein [Colletotrichum truncatum]|uniref:Camp-regulated phosphoprotein family protein n=1 Tax=Colletotrichum truncatum TaxID=5467 RepID=A0ACC3ZE79_COLTU|nr:camp-regulated phosphoprotein family protein [Colletotrichum truncatum]KAF6801307.1 camp-regulated phosphoprotein family protein [Colletotrichum truncatum]
MNPLQKNKIDVSSLSPEEQRLFRLYGKLPSRSDHFAKHLKERKYFDSGDYAMSKAGKGDSVDTGAVGSQHPVPENIPHLSSPVNNSSSSLNGAKHHPSVPSGAQAGSPVKESSFLNRETSAEEVENKDKENSLPVDGAAKTESIPIRR